MVTREKTEFGVQWGGGPEMRIKQAGNGPSRRYFQGSKIAKGLQNFKVLLNWEPFYEKNVSQCQKKTEREDPFGFFNIHSVAKLQKN